MQLLLTGFELDANIHARTRDGATPLHAAVTTGHYGIAGLLLNVGADATVRNGRGKRASQTASAGGCADALCW